MHLLIALLVLYWLFPRFTRGLLMWAALAGVLLCVWAWSASQGGVVDCQATPDVSSCTAWWDR